MRARVVSGSVGFAVLTLVASAGGSSGAAASPRLGSSPGAAGASIVDIEGAARTAASGSEVDVRRTGPALAPDAAQRSAAGRLLAAAGTGATLQWDTRLGTPRRIARDGGYLTGPAAGDPAAVARSYLGSIRAAFGLSAADVAALAVERSFAQPGGTLRVVVFRQTFGGLTAAYAAAITVAIAPDGRVLSVTGNAVRSSAAPAASRLDASAALQRAAEAERPGAGLAPRPLASANGWAAYDRGPFYGTHYVRKVAFPTTTGVRPAYRVIFHREASAIDDLAIDAETGAVLYRSSLVEHATDQGKGGLVFLNYPGAPRSPGQVRRSFAGDPVASPNGWLGDRQPVFTTEGNNARAYGNWFSFVPPGNGERGPRPTPENGQFNYRWPDAWHDTSCGGNSYRRDLNPAATNLFYHHNRIHDELYALGFTEAAGNFQGLNFRRGGEEGDPVQGLVQDAAEVGGIDNAFFATPPDGVPPFSGMFLWAPIPGAFLAPCVDGDVDAGVIQHEYVHGLTNRMVGGGLALNGYQAGAMGEGWSDFYALSYLAKNHLQENAVVGPYVTGNRERGIRNWEYQENPLNYGDLGYDVTGPQVHADGELWAATLWELWNRLVAKHGLEHGARTTEQIVTDALPLTPAEPTMLEARDAILAADTARYGGEHRGLIWHVFAQRGMGASASASSTEDDQPTPGFDSRVRSDNGAVRVRVVDSAGRAVRKLSAYVGPFEARVTPIARTDRGGGFGAPMVAGRYSLTLAGPGYGARTLPFHVRAGNTTRLTVQVSKNLASVTNGARVVKASSTLEGFPARNLLDDTEATTWATATAPDLAVRSGTVTVRLGARSTIGTVQLSAYKDPEIPRFAAMKDWTLLASDDGRTFRRVASGTFPTTPPRPVAPALHYRSMELPTPVQARYVRLHLRTTQGVAQLATAAEIQLFSGRP